MQLNSILFPAPKCSYTAEMLKGELIWIPRPKKANKASIRFTTLPSEDRIKTVSSISGEAESKLFPTMSLKKSMPRTPSLHSKVTPSKTYERAPTTPVTTFNNFLGKKNSKSTVELRTPGYRNTQVSPCVLKLSLDSLNDSEVQEEVPIETRLPENLEFKLITNQRNDSSFDDSGEINLSFEAVEEKKCYLSKNFVPSGKTSKNTTSTSENSIINEDCIMSIAQERKNSLLIVGKFDPKGELRPCPGPHITSKPAVKRIPTFKLNLSKDKNRMSIDVESFEEFPITTQKLSTPRQLHNYRTKTPQRVQEVKNPPAARMLEFSKKVGSQTSRNSDRMKENLFSAKNTHHSHSLNHNHEPETFIPCMVLKSGQPCSKLMIYFHGNGEDIYLAYDLLSHLRNNLNVNILAVEYPGYGMYKGSPEEGRILEDAEIVYDYLVCKLKYNPKNLIIFGRSIGSGPATWLASRKIIGSLVLMSPFTSIRAIINDMAGKWATYLVKERFNNLECMGRVVCPTFLCHGLKDRLISYKHSQDLSNACKGPCELVLPKTMDHVEFDFFGDFTEPLMKFFGRCNFDLRKKPVEPFEFKPELYETPHSVCKQWGIVN